MKTKEEKRFQVFSHIVLLIFALFCIIPLVLLLMSSFEENSTLIREGYGFWPKAFSFEAYEYLFRHGGQIFTSYFVTFFVTVVGTAVSIVLTTMLAYPLSRDDLLGRKVLGFLVFFTMLFNGGLVPTYLIYTNTLHLKNTVWAVIVPRLLLGAYYVLLMKSFFTTSIPKAIIEAAKVDGAGEYRILVKVIVPMSKPIIATVLMLTAINYWNDWYNGFIYITTKTEYYTIQALLNRMLQDIQYLSNNAATMGNISESVSKIPSTSVRMAISVVGLLPILIVYPFVQNSFVKGITLGAVKG